MPKHVIFVAPSIMDATLRFVAGAGDKSTFRFNNTADLDGFLQRSPPDPAAPSLPEEFVQGKEYFIARHPDSSVVEQALQEIVKIVRVASG